MVAITWKTSTSTWLEDTQSGQFVLAARQDLSAIEWQARASLRLADVAQLLGAALPKACQCAPIYPEDFHFCPRCGQPLATANSTPPSNAPTWWGPCIDSQLPQHVPHGLPVTCLPIAAAIESRPPEPEIGQADRRMPSPPNAQVVFAASHFGFASVRLIALAYLRNVLQYWEPIAGRWHLLTKEKESASLRFSASEYAWLPASNLDARLGEVGLIPSEQGLLRLFINPISESYHTEVVLTANLLSAPGAVGKHIACLIERDGRRWLWCAQRNGEQAQEIAVDAAHLPVADWSAPISYDNSLMWLHEEGQLLWQADNAQLQWLAWPTGWTPRLQLSRPTQSRDGRLWLMGHDGTQFCFLELGKSDGEMYKIDGARLGFADLLFRRGHRVFGQPWEAEFVEDPQADDYWVLPLLRHYDHQTNKAAGLVLRFSGKESAENSVQAKNADVQVRWSGQCDVILAHLPRLTRPVDSTTLVYDNCLWLHNPNMDDMLGWQL